VIWLNYHHLYYFWVVAREGTLTAASKKLRLAQPTVSAQVRALEKTLGHKLFRRVGRNLALTDTGRVVYRYAGDIFSLGEELLFALEQEPAPDRRVRLRVGIADVLSKQAAYRILQPVLKPPGRVNLICYEGKPTPLLARLAVNELDLVLSDSPVGPEAKLKAFNHLLGVSPVSVFAPRALAARYRRGFPASLDRAPLLLPTENTSLRRSLELWFMKLGIRPTVIAEFEDIALLKVFAQAGHGLFAASAIIEEETERKYNVRVVGRPAAVKEQYFAISVERKLKHPGVVAIVEAARREIFA